MSTRQIGSAVIHSPLQITRFVYEYEKGTLARNNVTYLFVVFVDITLTCLKFFREFLQDKVSTINNIYLSMKNNFKFLVGAALALSLVVVSGASAAYSHTTLLKMGSKGSQVMSLQQTLNGGGFLVSTTGAGSPGMETTTFAGKTKAAVMAFQSAKGLGADGIVGVNTGTALAAMTGGSVSYPAGCTSSTGYSTVNGSPCTSTGNTSLPAGCMTTSGFSTTTGVKCDSGASSLPAGCSTSAGFSPTTGTKCDSTTGSTNTGALSGGAADLDITPTSTDTENSVKEGATEKVVAFKGEADGGDVAVTNLKVNLANISFASSSERLTDYADSVSVWMGSTKVGSANASDFSRDSGSPDVFSKTIALSNAVVRDGQKNTFFIAVEANSTIDSDDITNADWVVGASTVRYTDATGAILSKELETNVATNDTSYDETITFEDASIDDDISIKSSTSNPVASNLQVSADNNSDSFLVGVFKLDVDQNSSDIQINEIPVVLTIDDSLDTANSDSSEDIIDSVTVKIGSKSFDADFDSEAVTNGDGTGTYLVTFDDGEMVINSGDDEEVKIYVTFKEQDTNYGSGTTVVASVTGSAIDAESDADDVTVTSSFTGKTHTLSVDAPTFDLLSKSFVSYQVIDGVGAGLEDVFLAKFTFNVTAADEDVYLSKGTEGDAAYTTAADTVQYTKTNGGTVNSIVLDAEDSSLDDGLTSSFLITAGSTEKFTLSFYVRGNDDSAKIAVDSFAYGTADDASSTYDYNSVVNTGLSAFVTSSTYLAK